MLSHLRYKERGSIPRRSGPISCYRDFCNMHNMQFNHFFDPPGACKNFSRPTMLHDIAKLNSKLPMRHSIMTKRLNSACNISWVISISKLGLYNEFVVKGISINNLS
jgi:hypothetical protein